MFHKDPDANIAYVGLPPEAFPIKFEFYRTDTKEVVFKAEVAQPKGDELTPLRVPPLKQQYGVTIGVRVKYGDGVVKEFEGDIDETSLAS